MFTSQDVTLLVGLGVSNQSDSPRTVDTLIKSTLFLFLNVHQNSVISFTDEPTEINYLPALLIIQA